MARRQRLSTWLVTVLCGLAVLAVGGLGWAHRQDLKRKILWWEVQRLEALRRRDPEAKDFQPTENRGLSRFDVAFSRLVKLQRPEFLGGRRILFFPLRGRQGKPVLAAVYEPMRYDFESPLGKDELEVVFYCNCKELELLLLDGSGAVLGDSVSEIVWMEAEPIRVAARGSHDVIRLSNTGSACSACNRAHKPWKEFSADLDGFVEHGLVAHDVPGAPACGGRRKGDPSRRSASGLAELLASGSGADAHRALAILERGDAEDTDLVELLLRHEEPLVRARAAVLASRVPQLREEVLSLLEDPDAGVRAGAIIAARMFPGWEAALLPVATGPDAALARRARLELVHSEDPGYARPALLRLVRDREYAAVYSDHRRVADGELADAVLDWLAEPLSSKHMRSDIGLQLHVAYPSAVLHERIDRMVEVLRAFSHEDDTFPADAFIDVLAKMDDPRADAALIAELERPGSVNVSRIVSTLYERGTPVQADAAPGALVPLIEEHGPCFESSCKEQAAVLLLRLGRPEGLRWFLRNLKLEEGELLPVTQVLGWMAGREDHEDKDHVAELEAGPELQTPHAGWGEADGERP